VPKGAEGGGGGEIKATGHMISAVTSLQMILMAIGYGVALLAAIYFTRATSRRIVGALAGGVIVALMVMGAIAVCESFGWWRIPSTETPYFNLLLFLGLAISSSPIYLVTWRLARRFGWRGLAVFIAAVGIIGPPRDYLIAKKFPEWMVFSPGAAPIIADCVTYIAIVAVGHAVMRIISGPAGGDLLARTARPLPVAR
jgi:hypothetical protein